MRGSPRCRGGASSSNPFFLPWHSAFPEKVCISLPVGNALCEQRRLDDEVTCFSRLCRPANVCKRTDSSLPTDQSCGVSANAPYCVRGPNAGVVFAIVPSVPASVCGPLQGCNS